MGGGGGVYDYVGVQDRALKLCPGQIKGDGSYSFHSVMGTYPLNLSDKEFSSFQVADPRFTYRI